MKPCCYIVQKWWYCNQSGLPVFSPHVWLSMWAFRISVLRCERREEGYQLRSVVFATKLLVSLVMGERLLDWPWLFFQREMILWLISLKSGVLGGPGWPGTHTVCYPTWTLGSPPASASRDYSVQCEVPSQLSQSLSTISYWNVVAVALASHLQSLG